MMLDDVPFMVFSSYLILYYCTTHKLNQQKDSSSYPSSSVSSSALSSISLQHLLCFHFTAIGIITSKIDIFYEGGDETSPSLQLGIYAMAKQKEKKWNSYLPSHCFHHRGLVGMGYPAHCA